MFPSSNLPDDLIKSYRETRYEVLGHERLTLLIDIHSTEIARLHSQHGVNSSAFITACNPFSASLTPAQNAERQTRLAEELTECGLNFIPGIGKHPSNEWPGEDSILILGLRLDAAKDLALRFEQNGFVWIGSDAVPQLILLR